MNITDTVLETNLQEVSALIDNATDDADELVKKPLRQTMRNQGKLLRPGMMVWAARSGICRRKTALLMAAASIELLHISSLIHDDIIDKGEIRRGFPSVHALFGNSVAVYTGDYTIIKSYKLLHDSGNDGLIYDFIMSTEKLCKSEIIQYQKRGVELSESEYLRIAGGKTGALFALALKTGAGFGGFDEKTCLKFERLGEKFGIAFQIADDCLDYAINGTVNKSVLTDLNQGLYTMPLILALSKDDGSLRNLLQAERLPHIQMEICRKVHEMGGVQMAEEKVRALMCECRSMLSDLPLKHRENYFPDLLNKMEGQNR